MKKNRKVPGFASLCQFSLLNRTPRHGLEEGANSSGNMTVSETGGAESGAVDAHGDSVDAQLQSLISAWPTLSDDVRFEILKLVHDSVSVSTTS